MRLKSALLLAATMLILAACGFAGGSNIKVGDGGSKNLGEKELERLFTKYSYQCDKGSDMIRFAIFIEQPPRGITITEISNVSFEVVEGDLTAAEKLNGYAFKGHIVFGDDTVTRYLKPQATWSDWNGVSTNGMGGTPRNNLHLKDGNWEHIGADWLDKGWRPMLSLFASDSEYIFHRNICD